MSMNIKEPIHFVISDSHFRKFWLGNILKLVGGIPKAKNIADSQTIRTILAIKNSNGVIGVYPEGKRNWDGTTLPIFYSTAKLIKSLKIPVITTVMKGAALSKPRWAKHSRRGEIDIKYNILLTPEKISDLSVDEIFEIVSKGIHVDEYSWQREKNIRFKGKQLAENLELFLYTCPNCHKIGNLESKNDIFSCKNCNYSIKYNEFGLFELNINKNENEKLYFEDTKQWNNWQLDFTKELIDNSTDSDCIFEDKCTLYTGNRKGELQ